MSEELLSNIWSCLSFQGTYGKFGLHYQILQQWIFIQNRHFPLQKQIIFFISYSKKMKRVAIFIPNPTYHALEDCESVTSTRDLSSYFVCGLVDDLVSSNHHLPCCSNWQTGCHRGGSIVPVLELRGRKAEVLVFFLEGYRTAMSWWSWANIWSPLIHQTKKPT